MRGWLRRALVDPGEFLASGEATRSRTWGLLVATALVSLGPIPLVVVLFHSEEVPAEVVGSLPALVYAAGEATVAVPGLYALLVGLAAAIPLLTVGIATPLFHGLSWPAARAGSLRQTAVVAVWGLLPQTIVSALMVVVLYVLYAAGVWPLGIHVTLPARVLVTRPGPSVPWLLLEAVGGLSVLWTGYVWIDGLAAVRDTTVGRAAAAVAIPLLVALLLTPPGSRLLNWVGRGVASSGCPC